MNLSLCCRYSICGVVLFLSACKSDRLTADRTASHSDVDALAQESRRTTPTARSAVQSPTTGNVVTYAPTLADFPNPERGFHTDVNFTTDASFSYVRSKGYTLARAYIRLDEYRHRRLPADFLTTLDRQFQLARAARIKLIPRFTYNFPIGGSGKDAADTSLDFTLAHVNQLKPILSKHADVIAVLQAGLVGAWGEWHSSNNRLDLPEPKAKILAALLTALPSNRMVQIRYPKDIQANYPRPLARADAYRGSRQARVAFHNDCFVSNRSDSGTYEPDIPALKQYTSQIAPFIAVGGETCALTPAEHRNDCPTVEAELAKFHWSYLTIDLYELDRSRWQQEGCFPAISRNLGYRLELVRSIFPSQIPHNRQLNGNFVVKNIGYASPFNPRGLELILRHRQTGKIYHLPILKSLSNTHDPRFWQPQLGEIIVNVRGNIPKTAPQGVYELLLNLPDPMPRLATLPEYSIRLANDRTWEAKTGFNSLRRTILLAK